LKITDQIQFKPLIHGRLETLRAELERSTDDAKPVSPDKAIGRLSRLDSMQMQQMSLNARSRQKEQIRQLEKALQRIEEGKFGTCLLCRRDIARNRLEYLPETEVCVECAGK